MVDVYRKHLNVGMTSTCAFNLSKKHLRDIFDGRLKHLQLCHMLRFMSVIFKAFFILNSLCNDELNKIPNFLDH